MSDDSAAELIPPGPPEPPWARDDRGRLFRLLGSHVERVGERGARRRIYPLDDPALPAFLDLPRLDLDDGRPLRRTAFEHWADVLRRDLEAGLVLETRYRPPEMVPAFLTLVGGGLVALACVLLVAAYAAGAGPRSGVQPTALDTLFAALGLGLLVYLFTHSVVAMRRAWHCRDGSFVHVDRRGIRTRKGQTVRPFTDVRTARYHRLLQCTRLEMEGDERVLFVPAEHGAMRRLDLLLAGLSPDLARHHPAL